MADPDDEDDELGLFFLEDDPVRPDAQPKNILTRT